MLGMESAVHELKSDVACGHSRPGTSLGDHVLPEVCGHMPDWADCMRLACCWSRPSAPTPLMTVCAPPPASSTMSYDYAHPWLTACKQRNTDPHLSLQIITYAPCADPLTVLLTYPSYMHVLWHPVQIIAYNLCYSTSIGRPAHARAGAAAAALRAQQQAAAEQQQHHTGGAGGAGAGAMQDGLEGPAAGQHGIRLGATTYALPLGALEPGGPLDPQRLVRATFCLRVYAGVMASPGRKKYKFKDVVALDFGG